MDKTQVITILEASNRLLLDEMTRLRKRLTDGGATVNPDAPYATLEKCKLEYEAVQFAIELMRGQETNSDQPAQIPGVVEDAYILRSDLKQEDVRTAPFTIEERLSNYRNNQVNDCSADENVISGIVVVGLGDFMFAFDSDPFTTVLNVLEDKLIGDDMDDASYRFVGITADGSKLLVFVEGIDYSIADHAEDD